MATTNVEASGDASKFPVDFPLCLWQQRAISRRNDLTIRVGADGERQEDFHANSDVMMARSKWLRRVVLQPSTLEPELVEIPNMSPEQFRACFHFLHTDELSSFTTVEHLVGGLIGGKLLETDPLVDRCRDRLMELLRSDPVTISAKILKFNEKGKILEKNEPELFITIDQLLSQRWQDAQALHDDILLKRVLGNNNSSSAFPPQTLASFQDFNSLMDEFCHQHRPNHYHEAKIFNLTIDQDDYKAAEHVVGFMKEFESEREEDTKWRLALYPCGKDESSKDGIGVLLSLMSIQEAMDCDTLHAHCSFQVFDEHCNARIVRRELTSVFAENGGSFGFKTLLNRAALPQKFSIRVDILSSSLPPTFFQPSQKCFIDGEEFSRVSQKWNTIKNVDGSSENEIISSPLFGNEGVLWSIIISSTNKNSWCAVQLVKLPENLLFVETKVTFSFADEKTLTEDKTLSKGMCSKYFVLSMKNVRECSLHVEILYKKLDTV